MASTREYLIVTLECPRLPPEDRTYRGHRMVVVNACVIVICLIEAKPFAACFTRGLSWKPFFSIMIDVDSQPLSGFHAGFSLGGGCSV